LYLFNSTNLAAMTRMAGFKTIRTRTGTRGADGVFFFSNYARNPKMRETLRRQSPSECASSARTVGVGAAEVRPSCGEELVLEAS